MEKSKVLIILGMHRSGTSLNAHWLHEMGLSLGESLMPAASTNKNGHYEDLDFFHFHKEILDRNKLLYYTNKFDENVLTENDKKKADEIINKKVLQSFWAWKDPRTCLFVNFWDKFLRKKGLSPKYYHVYRPVEQVVDSLVRRDIVELKSNPNVLKRLFHMRQYQKKLKQTQKSYFDSWIFHLENMKTIHIKYPEDSIIVQANDMEISQEGIISKLQNEWGFPLNSININTIFEEKQFTNLPAISKYSDKKVQELHNYFLEHSI